MSKATIEELNTLHAEVAKALSKAIKPKPVLDKEGNVVGYETNAAALNVARGFLKDNNVEAIAVPGSPLGDLAKSLPYAGETPASSDDEEPYTH